MKKSSIITSILIMLFITSCSTSNDDVTPISATTVEANDLQVLREEEKLARDVYLFSYDKYALDIFNNIASSEQKHMDKILTLLNTYNLSDPALANRGEFTNSDLQTLYNDLTTQADISLLEALKVGATIEDLDINDIEEFESRTDKSDILDTYSKLKCGSRNHMRKYYAELLTNNYVYIAQFITEIELSEIINGSSEQCGNQ